MDLNKIVNLLTKITKIITLLEFSMRLNKVYNNSKISCIGIEN